MSDFVNEFWNWYVALVVLVSVVGCGVFLWMQNLARPTVQPGAGQTADTTGHVWDETLEEYNNPLPLWWMWLFYITVVFALVYVVLYPALGRFPGVFGWTPHDEYEKDVQRANEQVKPLFEKYLKMDLPAMAADKEAMEMGGRLFQTYCMQCHGANAQGSRDKGYPNLTDKDWLWGGESVQIIETISNGRKGLMLPYGGNKEAVGSEAGAKEVAQYVRSLSGLSHNTELAAKGKERYGMICIACHGPDGKGNPALGAPNLADKVWLYGGSEAKIAETIVNGRSSQMPAWKDFLGEAKIHVLAAYVLSLSTGVPAK